MRLSFPLIVLALAALAAAGGCAKRAEEVIIVPTCDCDEPCADCICAEAGKVGGAPAAGEAATVEKSR